MSPVAIQGVDKQGVYVNGVQTKQALSAANSTVNKGVYDATLLETVDADLAEANILSGTTIFGKLGTLSQTATHDIEDSAVNAALDDFGATSVPMSYKTMATGADLDLATNTQSYTAGSLAEVFAYGALAVDTADSIKMRLWAGGVQLAETAYIATGGATALLMYHLVSSAALSGSKIVKNTFHNYAGGNSSVFSPRVDTGSPIRPVTGIFAGSVKVV